MCLSPQELEKPPPDKYYGLRYHCWVLVLPGKREVGQGFFIEATTGEIQGLDWDQYLGVESLWNHRNVWVNMQDCSEGVANLVYDLGDATLWEYFFPNVDKPRLLIPGQEVSKESLDEVCGRGQTTPTCLIVSFRRRKKVRSRKITLNCRHLG